ncbi:hypothetical protein Sm713_64830 [Streptomyces sp. TS71-3]|nr:hypothetical protein Sm713_64830 [Streptomyces sp. TS71-3]
MVGSARGGRGNTCTTFTNSSMCPRAFPTVSLVMSAYFDRCIGENVCTPTSYDSAVSAHRRPMAWTPPFYDADASVDRR